MPRRFQQWQHSPYQHSVYLWSLQPWAKNRNIISQSWFILLLLLHASLKISKLFTDLFHTQEKPSLLFWFCCARGIGQLELSDETRPSPHKERANPQFCHSPGMITGVLFFVLLVLLLLLWRPLPCLGITAPGATILLLLGCPWREQQILLYWLLICCISGAETREYRIWYWPAAWSCYLAPAVL